MCSTLFDVPHVKELRPFCNIKCYTILTGGTVTDVSNVHLENSSNCLLMT